jgi:KDO2-lipid IV(A) lauroyltransferase
MPRNRVADYLVYVLVRILICIVQALPMEMGWGLARRLAWLLGQVLRVRAEVVDDNLKHAFPDLSAHERRELARRMWEHLFLLAVEVAHIPRKIHETNWREYVRLHEVAPLVRQLLSGRPVIIVTGHFGNFELGGYALGILGFPTYTVARNLDNPYLDRFLARFRGASGQYLIPKSGGYEQLLAVLARGETIALLADQYAGEKACWVEFFGRPASVHKAIALLALEHDAPVVVCYARRLERPMQFEMTVCGMVDPRATAADLGTVRDLTQWFTRKLEETIRSAPQQYWWLHRRWKDPRKKRRALKQAA